MSTDLAYGEAIYLRHVVQLCGAATELDYYMTTNYGARGRGPWNGAGGRLERPPCTCPPMPWRLGFGLHVCTLCGGFRVQR